MVCKLITYRTLTGIKKILEPQDMKSTEAIIYKNNRPLYYVDCFDLKTESNIIMNSLVLGQKRSIDEIIKEVAQKNNVNLSVKKAPLFAIKQSYELMEVSLSPLPEYWLN